MKRILLIVAVTALALLGFTHFSKSNANTEGHEHAEESHGHGENGMEEHSEEEDFQNIPLTDKQMKAVDLKMGEVSNRELNATLKVNGALVLRPQSIGDVAALMGGIVKGIYVKEGQHVSKGQVVATIENTDVVSLQREYFSASKECQLARTEKERQENLAQGGAGVKKNLQQAQKTYQVAWANLVGIGRQLAQIGISPADVAKGKFTTVFPLRAPISGTVSQLTASLGSYADMQTPLMKIRDNGAVECDLNVFEQDIDKIKNGNKVLLSLTNQPGVKISGHVYGMNEYFNDGTKSVAVHVKLDATRGKKLFDGMYVSGQIAIGRQLYPALPSKAIVAVDGKNYVFALNQGSGAGKYEFSRHEVKTGVSEDGYTAVSLCKHIKKGQKIVTDNAFYLASMTGEHGEHNH